MVERIFLMRIRFLILFFLPLVATAQFTYTIDQSIPVTGLDGNALIPAMDRRIECVAVQHDGSQQ
jgi:hypothetical protein